MRDGRPWATAVVKADDQRKRFGNRSSVVIRTRRKQSLGAINTHGGRPISQMSATNQHQRFCGMHTHTQRVCNLCRIQVMHERLLQIMTRAGGIAQANLDHTADPRGLAGVPDD